MATAECRLDIVRAAKGGRSEVYEGKLKNFESLGISHSTVQLCAAQFVEEPCCLETLWPLCMQLFSKRF